MKMELRIEHTWDGLPVSHDPVAIALQSYDAGLLMQVSAPFFNDPPAPLGAPGKPFRKLWYYEGINKFNAFAIHGSGDHRKYEALYPVPRHKLLEGQKPDFHRLEFFQELNLKELMGEDWKQPESDIWTSHTK